MSVRGEKIVNYSYLELEKILLYFEKHNLQISSQLADKLKTYSYVVESLSKYKKQVKAVLDEKVFYLHQMEEFLKNIKAIKTLFLDLGSIYNEMGEDYEKISLILNNILDLVIKIPFVTKVQTYVTKAVIGDTFHVWDTKKDQLYVIDHPVLIEFLNNIKNLVIPENTSDIQNSPISDKLNQIIKTIPAIKAEYLPNVVYANIPESFEQIVTFSKDLRELFSPIYFLEEFGPLREFMELLSNDFDEIERFFKTNPDKDSIKLKGKLKKNHSNLNKLYQVLSFKRHWDY